MKVNKIIEYACLMLEKENLLDSPLLIGEEDQDVDRKTQLLKILECVNATLLKVVSYYKPLTATTQLESSDRVDLGQKVGQVVQNILSVKTIDGVAIPYKVEGKYLIFPEVRQVVITYSYFPKDVAFGEEVSYFVEVIPERILALSVVSDYYFQKGIADEMARYDDEFDHAMRSITRKKAEIYIKPRRWI